MDNVLDKLKQLKKNCSEWRASKDWEQLLQGAKEGADLESDEPRWQKFLAEACQQLKRHPAAEAHLAKAKELERIQWQRRVEAEVRGQHNLLGDK